MKPDDKEHIEAICRRHNIHLITRSEHEEAMLYNLMRGKPKAMVEHSCNARKVNKETGKWDYGIWLNPEHDGAPNDDAEYMAALHEIGHCVLEHDDIPRILPDKRPCDKTVQHEIEAWEWAYSHAQHWPNEEAMLWTLDCLGSYCDDWVLGSARHNTTDAIIERLGTLCGDENNTMNNDKEKIAKALLAKGFSEKDAQTIQNNIDALGTILMVIDKGLTDLNVKVIRKLNDFSHKAIQDGASLNVSSMEKLKTIADMAEQYQAKFGTDSDAQINAFPQKAVTA